MKYLERPVQVPFCTQKADRHHPSDKSLCTYEAFLELAARVIPQDYRAECKVESEKK
jgi:acid phosphatase